MKIQTKFNVIEAALYGNVRGMKQELVTNGQENLMVGGNKAYYLGGGWWRLGTYTNGRDRAKTMLFIEAAKRGSFCKDCGKVVLTGNCCDACDTLKMENLLNEWSSRYE